MLFLICILLIHTLLSNDVYQLYTTKKQHKRAHFYLFLMIIYFDIVWLQEALKILTVMSSELDILCSCLYTVCILVWHHNDRRWSDRNMLVNNNRRTFKCSEHHRHFSHFFFCYTNNLSKVTICAKGKRMNTHNNLKHPKFIFILFVY